MTTKDDGIQRSFETGATRDTGEGKLDFEGFLSPFVLRQYAKYMNMNRLQSDGNLRDSDNWQKGIPMEVYMKSLYRHFFETWYTYRMDRALRDDRLHMPREQQVEYIGALCGMMFNAMGYLHEWLKLNPEVRFDEDEPTNEMGARQAKVNEAKRQAIKQEAKEEYTKAFEEYCNNWGDRLEIVKDINETPADQPCECSPGDCDCTIGRIYPFAMPEDVVFPPEDEESQGQVYGFAMPTDLYVDGDREDDWKITTEAPKYCPESLLDVEDGWDCDCDLCLAENGDEDAKERLKEDVQDGEVPLPDWVPSEKPTTFPTLKDAMGALFKYVGDDNIASIRVETIEDDDDDDDCDCRLCRAERGDDRAKVELTMDLSEMECYTCKWFNLSDEDHPCDYCEAMCNWTSAHN
jgi:hypothetical protein